MPTLRLNEQGPLAQLWNRFLSNRGFLPHADWTASSSEFTQASKDATRAFQKREGIAADGIPGNQTFGRACGLSAEDWFDPSAIASAVGVEYPKRDPSLPDATSELQVANFCTIVAEPHSVGGEGKVRVLNNFVEDWIDRFELPQLAKIPAFSGKLTRQMHKKAARQIQATFFAWEALGLLSEIRTFDGIWNLRYKRGSQKELSNHAWGSAFDINASANWLAHLPAFPGENGCLFSLVPIAQDLQVGWGGHYRKRLDGMHFEVLKLLSEREITRVLTKYGIADGWRESASSYIDLPCEASTTHEVDV